LLNGESRQIEQIPFPWLLDYRRTDIAKSGVFSMNISGGRASADWSKSILLTS
jgi:hypothetical protein